jgi:hypothetical protein
MLFRVLNIFKDLYFVILSLSVLSVFVIPGRTVFAQPDPCTVVFAQELDERKQDLFQMVRQDLGSDTPDQLKDSQLAEQAPYWVTITTGPARWVDCKARSVNKSLFFPIGLVLRPVSQLEIGGDVHTIFQTEYGLRVIISEDAIAPITEDDAYVFANGNAVYQVCKPNDSECDAKLPLQWSQSSGSHWPYLNGRWSYLHSTEVQVMQQAHANWEILRSRQDEAGAAQPGPFSSDYPTSFEDESACGRRQAYLFALGVKPNLDVYGRGAEFPNPVRFRYCFRDPDGIIRAAPVRTVTKDLAEAMFGKLWSATAPTHLDGRIDGVIRRAFNFKGTFLTKISCGQEVPKDHRTYGWLGRGRERDGPVNISDEIELDTTTRQQAFHYRTYLTHMGRSDYDSLYDGPIFHDIELVVECTASMTPSHPVMLRIHYPPIFSNGPLELNVVKVEAMFDALLDKYGTTSDRVRKQRLDGGKLFRICDFNEYSMWRAVLGQALRQKGKTQEAAENLGVSIGTMADHLTHLIMASVFQTGAKMRSKQRQQGTCET